jgi:hypothetical protein
MQRRRVNRVGAEKKRKKRKEKKRELNAETQSSQRRVGRRRDLGNRGEERVQHDE